MPLSASAGETADGQPNTERNFLSTQYLQNHRLGTKLLEGHLDHSPVSRTICTKIVLVTRLPISLTQKMSPERGLSLSAEALCSAGFEASTGKCSLKTKLPSIVSSFIFGPVSSSDVDSPKSAWPPGFCWDALLGGSLFSSCWMPAGWYNKASYSQAIFRKVSKDNWKFWKTSWLFYICIFKIKVKFIYLKVHSFIFIHMYKGCFVVSQLFVQRNEKIFSPK